MGDYNPYRPQILGQEWVPIRDEDLELSPATNFVEAGHGFTLATSRQVRQGRYYVNFIPPAADQGQNLGIAVYPAGLEDQSGPVESVIIPVSSAICTGGTPSGDVTGRLLTPTNFQGGVTFQPNTASTMGIRMQFAFNRYPQLNGKRILGINLLYAVAGSDGIIGPALGSSGPTQVVMTTEFDAVPSVNFVFYDRLRSNPDNEIIRVPLGELNPFWTATSPVSTPDRMHWIYSQLLRWDTVGALPKLFITVATGNSLGTTVAGDALFFYYAALEVLYCEEQRVVFGAVQLGTVGSTLGKKTAYGANIVTVRDMAYTADPVLPAGDYTAVVTSPFAGTTNFGLTAASDYPFLNAARELYAIPPHPGVQVNIPFPMDPTAVGDVLTTTTLHVLPQVSLHASGGTLTEPHVYGRQAAAQVYGSNTATQEIYDDVLPGATVFEQVRYVARRFGDTTVPLTLTGTGSLAGSTVSITVDEFDALTEIIDGWKEVTLRFASPPTMGTLATPEPSWTWSAAGETAGNRWEILAACAPAITGTPGNLQNLVPSPNQLYEATYQPPAGPQAELTWMPQGVGSPYVTGATEDDSTDAFLIFSQDPPTVTGVALTALTQTVTGIGFDCGSLPCCIPSGISYQRITWSQQTALHVTQQFLDTFSRTAASTWGTANTGQVYQTSGGTAADYNVTGGVGTVALPTTAARNVYTGPAAGTVFTDVEYYAEVTIPAVATGDVYDVVLMGREDLNNNNYYGLNAEFTTAGAIDVFIFKDVGGVFTTLTTSLNVVPYAAGDSIGLRFRFVGTTILGKVWNRSTQAEPAAWTGTATDSSIASGGVGTLQSRGGANTNVGLVISWDNISATDLVPQAFGGYELQRFDTTPGATFETIMLATSPYVTGFNDYEARVGIDSVYRIRNLNVYNFAGAWSTQVTGAPPEPGVTGGCDDQTGALIFTSNADQSGASNAAYVMQWESEPVEDFNLPEADQVVFQALYGRDGVVAFHGTERGLEEFARVLLIQAAAIDPIRLADVKTLRDLAWADLPYICVRDDIGDRWFANVQVPTVNARMNRTTYMARVDIRELTRTPYAVDP